MPSGNGFIFQWYSHNNDGCIILERMLLVRILGNMCYIGADLEAVRVTI